MFRVLPKFRTAHHLIVLLTLSFILTFIYHERVVPYRSAHHCEWPKIKSTNDSKKVGNMDATASSDYLSDQNQDVVSTNGISKVLLIADPQLIDNHTYPGRNPFLLSLSKHTVDVYLKKNYKALVKNLKPDYIFFLGDYLDNGRSSSETYFQNELERFISVFKINKYKKDYIKDKNLFLNLPGNHDIGWANGVKVDSRNRFQKYFGNPNSVNTINNVDFISLDTISLSSTEENINHDSRQFLDSNFGDSIVKTKPRILLSHVPLNRDPDLQTCGPFRESSKFHLSSGYQYKLTLEPELSNELLNKIKPELIFSGDDHDYCDMLHNEINDDHSFNPREITVKSISMAMGIKYPAVQLLTFQNPDSDSNSNIHVNNFQYETDLCYLPTPYINILHYVILSVLSGCLLLWWNVKVRSSRYNYSILPSSIQATAILSNSSNGNTNYKTTNSSSNAAKISSFLQEQDKEISVEKPIINSIPKYTFTSSNNHNNNRLKHTKIFKTIKRGHSQVSKFLKRWNLCGFFKHCLFLGIIVVAIYYFGFVLTI